VLGYLYMVMSWGGYSFVINLLPIFCLASIVTGRLSSRLYIAFAPLVVMGTLVAGACLQTCVELFWEEEAAHCVWPVGCDLGMLVAGAHMPGC